MRRDWDRCACNKSICRPVKGQIAGTAPGEKTFDFLAAGKVDHRNVATQAIRDVERRAVQDRDDSAGLESGGKRLNHLPARRINDGNGVGPGIRDIELAYRPATMQCRGAHGRLECWRELCRMLRRGLRTSSLSWQMT